MKRKAKKPARPNVQPDAPKKKRRRARRSERDKTFFTYGVSAECDYSSAVDYRTIGNRRAEAFAKNDVAETRKTRRRRKLGRLILAPFIDDAAKADKRKEIARRRRKDAIMAQAARRAGRCGVSAASVGKRGPRKPQAAR